MVASVSDAEKQGCTSFVSSAYTGPPHFAANRSTATITANPTAVEAQLHHLDLGDAVQTHKAANNAHGHGQKTTLKSAHHASVAGVEGFSIVVKKENTNKEKLFEPNRRV
jgi:hypothetical protein